MKTENLPTLADLAKDIEQAYQSDQLNLLLNQHPPLSWVKEHPYIKQEVTIEGQKRKVPYKYLPIDKVEHLLRKIFKLYRIEITGQGQAFNGVWVTVRVHYLHPTNGTWEFHDGIGAAQLQTKQGTSPADLLNVNNGALSMAFPNAKTIAIKDACDMFGTLFGANLNRRDAIEFKPDANLSIDWTEIKDLYELKQESCTPDEQMNIERVIKNEETASYKKVIKILKSK